MPLVYGASPSVRDSLRPARIVLLLFLAAAFCLNAALAQVVIRERIGITPSLPPLRSQALLAQDSTVVLYTPVGGRIYLSSTTTTNCNYVQYLLADPINFVKCGSNEVYVPGNWKAGTAIKATAVLYPSYPYKSIYPVVSIQHLYGYTYIIHFPDVYYDLTVVIVPGPDFDHFRLTCAPDTIIFADTSTVTVTSVDAGNQEVALSGTSLLTFSIDSTRFGKFLSPSGTVVASPLTGVTYSDARAGKVRFIASESLTCSLSTARLRVSLASDPSKTGTDTVTIKDPLLAVASYRVSALPDTIAYGDTTSITVTALNRDLRELLIKPSTLLTLTLDSTRYGSFITSGGSVVSSPLSGVAYGDARAGKVKFVANGARDAAPVKGITVHVSTGRADGTGTLLLAHAVVNFAGPDSLEMFPRYPGHNTSTATCDSVGVDMRVTFLGVARPGAWVRIAPPPLADNGGHTHGGDRPRTRFSIEQPEGSGVWVTSDTLLAQVNSLGMLHVRLIASPAGGWETVVAGLQSDETASDTLALWTRVPGLMLLPDGVNYVKVGGTDLHHGPRIDDLYPDSRTPDENHYGTPEVIRLIQAIADSLALQSSGLKMTVGDMSLKYGGLFDDEGGWQPGHATHRLGTNVDLPYELVAQGRATVPLGDLKRRLHRIIMNLTDTESLDEPVKLQIHVFFEQ